MPTLVGDCANCRLLVALNLEVVRLWLALLSSVLLCWYQYRTKITLNTVVEAVVATCCENWEISTQAKRHIACLEDCSQGSWSFRLQLRVTL